MSSGVVRCAFAAALLAAPALAAHAGGYPYSYGGYDSGSYGRYGYGYQGPAETGYAPGGYGYDQGGYGYAGYGGDEGYGYGSSPWSAPARYCAEHLAYHERQAWMNDQAPYNDWWGTGSPWAWHEQMEADHARFHYTHPGSWRCMYQGWPAG